MTQDYLRAIVLMAWNATVFAKRLSSERSQMHQIPPASQWLRTVPELDVQPVSNPDDRAVASLSLSQMKRLQASAWHRIVRAYTTATKTRHHCGVVDDFMFLTMNKKTRALFFCFLMGCAAPQLTWAAHDLAAPVAATPVATPSTVALADRPDRANFNRETASPEARKLADWVLDSDNNRHLPFIILDKINAKVFVFDPSGHLRGAAPALLGLAVGDDSVPGIGDRELSTILPEERTTPAGRFVAALDRNLHGKQMLWVDYEAAISLHPVITTNPQERRAQRLATPTLLDKRISYGCINVPTQFFAKVVSPAFAKTNGIVYVMPEVKSVEAVFGSYDVDRRSHRLESSDSLVLTPQTSAMNDPRQMSRVSGYGSSR